ncbi:hypothetical protein B0I35DRAFT_409400 [Stachybotrys elegans]|uniref:Homeobox domain-containing protein n=1 Tax=Stachybotrys elegans TaxID=80388 RepID=A0A8K0WQM8_9HYPO|nr:hypothetical protein B0I35DRAFT_409400 [Stachybotrys elegans]
MILTRHTEQNHWPLSKFGSSPLKPTSLRMSNHYENSISAQSGWQGQYQYLPQNEGTAFSQPFEQTEQNIQEASQQPQSRSSAERDDAQLEVSIKNENSPQLPQHRSLDPLGLRQNRRPSPIPEQEESQGDGAATKGVESTHEESVASTGTPSLSMGTNPLSSVSSAAPTSDGISNPVEDAALALKDEDAEDDDDDVMDDDLVDGDNENSGRPQTAAERAAARRKMKRFRLTHQQTRFLMSEFAKQPHPDAAHRERLSREIPGLSPRQVQVWFQNRRAKIKRLTVDDRERMIKMRAVPDDFDNVQALHSPYGAVHGLGGALSSPASMEFGAQHYGETMLRPLMVDVRRPDVEDHLSPTAITPAFGTIGFHPSGSLSSPDIMSPVSPTSSDRYTYASQVSTPLSSAPRSANPFMRQNSLDAAMQMNRQGYRPLQPLHLREPMSRARSESLQSPLRSSMSWKTDAMDYASMHGSAPSPALSERPSSVYQPSSSATSAGGGMPGFDNNSYPGSGNLQQAGLGYQAAQPRSRLRAATATLPLNLDLGEQFRHHGPGSRSPAIGSGNRLPSSSSFGHSIYTTSYPPAPLTAPMDFAPPSPAQGRSGMPEYSTSQLNHPIGAHTEFSPGMQSSRAPMRDSFSHVPSGFNMGQERTEGYGKDGSGPLKRERSYTLPSNPS